MQEQRQDGIYNKRKVIAQTRTFLNAEQPQLLDQSKTNCVRKDVRVKIRVFGVLRYQISKKFTYNVASFFHLSLSIVYSTV